MEPPLPSQAGDFSSRALLLASVANGRGPLYGRNDAAEEVELSEMGPRVCAQTSRH